MRPLLQSQLSPILTNTLLGSMRVVEISAINNSACDKLILRDFPFFNTFFAVSTSAWKGGPVLTAISIDGSGSASLSGFFRQNKPLHLFEAHCAFLSLFNSNLELL